MGTRLPSGLAILGLVFGTLFAITWLAGEFPAFRKVLAAFGLS
ncbi:hypothetical protein LNKW23_05530 [Paralimibaculum aggregatum]|uniref:Uncharacterized protein n=1 Tax=Paralimibaculum aggregatum TaxID=3036245 RepID=A0ABQ6LM23_9RHOB|nr:hypothetical protein [Limibaculum sp. NKW23]GMG81340.1 hypothetical protein LNKW23_05530 [Limibaculum sp. NKW23]